MVRSIQSLSVVLLLMLASAASGQTSAPCGIVGIDGPSEAELGTPLVFKAKITGLLHAPKTRFNWSVSAGTIMAGQGTPGITVDTTGLGGVEVIATVELSGAPAGCKKSASRTTQVKPPAIVCGIAFDRYGDLDFEDEKARLDNFAIQLLNVPESSGYIFMTAGMETFENEALERLDRAKSYIVNVRELDPNRIVTVDCGFSQEFEITLRIIPPGILPPQCINPIEVPLSEIKFTKRRPNSSNNPR